MEGAAQIFGTSQILQDYERDPVFISLRSANEALQKQVADLSQKLSFIEGILVKRLNVNFEAATKDMCQLVKKDKGLAKRLEESLRSQNTPNTNKLLEIFLKETGPEEGFVMCGSSNPTPPPPQNADNLNDELSYYLEKMQGGKLSEETKINIQSSLDEANKIISGSSFDIGYYALGTLKITWVVSKFIYKESLRVGTALLAATPLILFLLLVNEINKLAQGWIFQTALSGMGLIGSGLRRLT